MDLTQLANVGEFIGGVAVLVTLIYLVIQLRHSNQTAQAASRQALIDTAYNFMFQVGRDRSLCKIMGEGMADLEGMSDADRSQFNLVMLRFVGNLQNGLLLWQQGLLDQSTLDEIVSLFATSMRTQGGAFWWRTAPVSAQVRAYVEAFDKRAGSDLISAERMFPYWIRQWDREPSDTRS